MAPYPSDPKELYKGVRSLSFNIGVASFVFGFLSHMLNQNIITGIYSTLVKGKVEQLLLHLPNLQFIHQYLIEHDNLLHWERVAVFFAAHTLLLPFVVWLILAMFVRLPTSLRSTWNHNTRPIPTIRPQFELLVIVFSTFMMPTLLYIFTSELFTMDQNDIAGVVGKCRGLQCIGATLMTNSLHLHGDSFLTLPLMFYMTLLMFMVCTVMPTFYVSVARRFYDNLQAKKQPRSNPPQS